VSRNPCVIYVAEKAGEKKWDGMNFSLLIRKISYIDYLNSGNSRKTESEFSCAALLILNLNDSSNGYLFLRLCPDYIVSLFWKEKLLIASSSDFIPD